MIEKKKWEGKMALINCPECGKEISDKAKQCVYCGYPINESTNDLITKRIIIICVSLVLVADDQKAFLASLSL